MRREGVSTTASRGGGRTRGYASRGSLAAQDPASRRGLEGRAAGREGGATACGPATRRGLAGLGATRRGAVGAKMLAGDGPGPVPLYENKTIR